jgi:hypothetical protein
MSKYGKGGAAGETKGGKPAAEAEFSETGKVNEHDRDSSKLLFH